MTELGIITPIKDRVIREERKRVERITLEKVISDALQNPVNIEAAQWLTTTEKADSSPTRAELNQRQMTEFSFLTLTGKIRSFPGGFASSFAPEIIETDLAHLHKDSGQEPITILAMIHGALMPVKPENVRLEPEEALQRTRDCKAKDYHQHTYFAAESGGAAIGRHLHQEMSCGATSGNSENTRFQASENIKKVKEWAKQQGIAIRVIPIEAIVKIDSNEPQFRIFNETFMESEDNWSTGGNPCQYPVEKLMPAERFNDFLRRLLDRNQPMVGLCCSDSRQGSLVPHPSIEPIAPKISRFAGREHTESIGIPLLENDEEAKRIAYHYLIYPQVKLRTMDSQTTTTRTPARPFLINVPEGVLRNRGTEIQASLQNLFTTLDTDILRRVTALRTIKDFIKMDDNQVVEVTTQPGLQILIPEGEFEQLFDGIRPGIRIFNTGTGPDLPTEIDRTPYAPYHPQGDGLVVSRRKLGPKFRDLKT